MLKGFGKDVVLISHMDEKDDNGSLKERLKIQGESKDLVLTDSDVIARISVANKQRHLIFSPTETAFGKDPARIEGVEIPDQDNAAFRNFLGDKIAEIKDALNSLSEEQVVRKNEVEWFLDTLPRCETPEDVNGLISRAKSAGRDVSKMLADRAKELGLEFDPGSRKYIDPSAVDQIMNDEAARAESEQGEAA